MNTPLTFCGGVIIEHIGIIHPTKQQDLSIRVVARLMREGVSASCIFIGSYTEGSAYISSLRKLIEELNVADRVFFVGQKNNVEDWLDAADMVIIPSTEGLSLVGLEAFAAGKAVVATERCGVGELVRTSGTGYTYGQKDEEAKACECIKKAMVGHDGQTGRNFARQNDVESYCDRLKTMLTSIG